MRKPILNLKVYKREINNINYPYLKKLIVSLRLNYFNKIRINYQQNKSPPQWH